MIYTWTALVADVGSVMTVGSHVQDAATCFNQKQRMRADGERGGEEMQRSRDTARAAGAASNTGM